MTVKAFLQSILSHPLTRGLDLDSPETTLRRRTLIKKKRFLNKFYQDCYRSIAGALPDTIEGPVLELGSGGGFIKAYIPDCITSEVYQLPDINIALDGQRLPFTDASLRGIVMLDVFHHLPRIKSFLKEAGRCVKDDGCIVMIEPWKTTWSRLIYTYLHHEPFNTETPEWEFPSGGLLSNANSALPWIVFERDRRVFEREFPEWNITFIQKQSPFCYLLSGGVSLRSLAPGWLYPCCRAMERITKPWMNYLAMFALIVLVKTSYKRKLDRMGLT